MTEIEYLQRIADNRMAGIGYVHYLTDQFAMSIGLDSDTYTYTYIEFIRECNVSKRFVVTGLDVNPLTL